MNKRVAAWLNLAYYFARHVLLRMPLRALRDSHDARRFLDAVAPEGYVPLLPAERVQFPATMTCIQCGLCSLACPALREGPASAWVEAWTFVAGPSRAIDRARLVEAPPCAQCAECAAVCPTGVPIPQLAALVTRMARTNAVAL
jgi:succinate dehydrogenase/fumarate reductase-like Fe-S protein